ncbi:hypothetical protein [Acinetobacter sp. WZC-1]|uniref:hypothetical protein n=1 Tax=Acinetobacter sp. WZC-1 TaxID=3459034 RepID=UPI00403E0573
MVKITAHFDRIFYYLFFPLVAIIETYCALNASYIAIIGGTSFYFFAALILIIQTFLVLIKKIPYYYSAVGILLLLLCLWNTHGFAFFNYLKCVALIPAIFLSLPGLKSWQQKQKYSNALKIGLIVSLITLAATQHHELAKLKNYYSTLHNGETWQQFGAL